MSESTPLQLLLSQDDGDNEGGSVTKQPNDMTQTSARNTSVENTVAVEHKGRYETTHEALDSDLHAGNRQVL